MQADCHLLYQLFQSPDFQNSNLLLICCFVLFRKRFSTFYIFNFVFFVFYVLFALTQKEPKKSRPAIPSGCWPGLRLSKVLLCGVLLFGFKSIYSLLQTCTLSCVSFMRRSQIDFYHSPFLVLLHYFKSVSSINPLNM
jgi:hypothetical protein